MSNQLWKSAKYKHVQPTFLSSRSKVCKQSLLCEAGCTKGKLSERKSEMKRKVRNVNMSNHHWKSAKYKHVQSTFLPSRSKLCKQSLLCEVGCTKKKFSERKSEMERKVQNVNMSNQIFSRPKKEKKCKMLSWMHKGEAQWKLPASKTFSSHDVGRPQKD